MSDANANLFSPVDYVRCEQEASYRLLDVKVLDDLKQAIENATKTTSQGKSDSMLVRTAVAG